MKNKKLQFTLQDVRDVRDAIPRQFADAEARETYLASFLLGFAHQQGKTTAQVIGALRVPEFPVEP